MPNERRSDYIDLHERMTAQETLMGVVRDDVSEIKMCIVGNNGSGLSKRVAILEGSWTRLGGIVRGVGIVLGTLVTLLGLIFGAYELFAK